MPGIIIEGSRALTLAVSGTGNATNALPRGTYDVWCDVDCWLRVDDTGLSSPDRPQDVTTANGYKIFAGNVVPVEVADGRAIGAIAGAAGTLSYHKTA